MAEKAYRLDPNREVTITTYGTASWLVGKVDQGIKLLEEARDISPAETVIQNNLGLAYLSANQPALALSEFKKAYQIAPSWDAGHKVISSYFAQPKESKILSIIVWLITIGIFILIELFLYKTSIA